MEKFPNLNGVRIIGVDTETYDPHLKEKGPGHIWKDGYIVGYSIATEDWCRYFPLRHEGGGNVPLKAGLTYLKDAMQNTAIAKAFFNRPYDDGWIGTEDIKVLGPVYDAMLAAPLIDENRRFYSLESLSSDWLGRHKDETRLQAWGKAHGIKPKNEMHKVPAAEVTEYGAQDASLALGLWNHCLGEIGRQDLKQIFELEMELQPMFMEMRRRGVRIDVDAAVRAKKKLENMMKLIHGEILEKWSVQVEPWAASSVGKACDRIGLEYPRTRGRKQKDGTYGNGAPSFTKEWLREHPHPFPQLVGKLRRYDKAIGTFLDSYLEHQVNGRIHAEIHQLPSDEGGTVTGRLSYSNPNLQQVTARDKEMAPIIRGIFLPEEGEKWLRDDYSQQEPRLTIHFAALARLPGAAEAVAQFIKDPNTDYHKMVAEMAAIERTPAKTINLGLAYGMGRVKLARALGMSLSEADEFMANYHKKIPYVRALGRSCANKAEARGFIWSLHRRKCRFPFWEAIDEAKRGKAINDGVLVKEKKLAMEMWGAIRRAFTHKAMNRLIQTSAADMTKLAMRDLWREGIVSLVQVHDELNNSIGNMKQKEKIERIMRDCVKLELPVKVDGKTGPTWAGAM